MLSRSWGYSPFWEGENRVVGSLCVMHKMFPYMNMCVDHVRPVNMPLRQLGDPPLVWQGGAPVSFVFDLSSWPLVP